MLLVKYKIQNIFYSKIKSIKTYHKGLVFEINHLARPSIELKSSKAVLNIPIFLKN